MICRYEVIALLLERNHKNHQFKMKNMNLLYFISQYHNVNTVILRIV